MRTKFSLGFTLIAAILYIAPCLAQHASFKSSDTKKSIDFLRDVQPILTVSCVQCHGTERQLGSLLLDSRLNALKGGISGPAIVPGNMEKSLLLARAIGLGGKPRMPLGFAQLSSQQITTLKTWIVQGAAWPEAKAVTHWAYIKPVHPFLPNVKLAGWVKNPIDRFILAHLESERLKPSPSAPRPILLRRVYLDLIGLPPTPDEVAAFVNDKRPDAYERVVDSLLANPAYGERWSRPWLDLARYADTNGYEKDDRRSMWPYRDWVIKAYNSDMPYNQFTMEQIAGDLLPNASMDQKIASGFHRNTMFNAEGGVDQEEQRWLTIVDRAATTGSVWLGSTLACAQCHNHKYDPFSQKEYYQFFAFFDHAKEPQLELATPEQAALRSKLQLQIADLEKAIKSAGTTKEQTKTDQAELDALKKQLGDIHIPTTLVMEEKTDKQIPSTYTRIKGAFLSKGELVQAATPSVLNMFPSGQPNNRLGLAAWLVDQNNPLTARVEVNRLWEKLFGRGIVETSEDFGTQGRRPSNQPLLDWMATEFMRRGWSRKSMLRLMVTSAAYKQSSHVSKELEERDPGNALLARGPRFRLEAEMIRDVELETAGLLSHKMYGPSVFPPQPEGIWNIPYSGDTWITSTGEDRFRRGIYTFWRRSAPYPAFTTFDATSREFCTVRRIRTNTPLQALNIMNDPALIEAARGLASRMIGYGAVPENLRTTRLAAIEVPREIDIQSKIAYGFRCCVARSPSPKELHQLSAFYLKEKLRYESDPQASEKLAPKSGPGFPSTGFPGLSTAECAAWTMLGNVLLNLDETLTKE